LIENVLSRAAKYFAPPVLYVCKGYKYFNMARDFADKFLLKGGSEIRY